MKTVASLTSTPSRIPVSPHIPPHIKSISTCAVRCVAVLVLLSQTFANQSFATDLRLPYEQVGLTEPQAAAILLDRFTYGARSGEVEVVVEQGLARWFEQQLDAKADETALSARLAGFPALGMTHQQLFGTYPSGAQSTAHARRFYDLVPPADKDVDLAWSSRKLAQFRREQGYQTQDGDLYRQLTAQKVFRAVYARNQLQEVLTEFWHNHFYVTNSNFRSRPWVLAYEREAIRPYALGPFRELLGAAVKHPAYLQATQGDAQKTTLTPEQTTMGVAFARLARHNQHATLKQITQQLDKMADEEDLLLQKRFWPETGNNSELARLLLQQTVGSTRFNDDDVLVTARIFTGWSTLPYGVSEQWFTGGFAAGSAAGFVQQGSFVFRADRHDALPKQAWGKRFAAGGGVEEGEQVLDVLANETATATHLATVLAEHFVGAQPDATLVDRLAVAFRKSHGDMKIVLRTLVQSKEFWRAASARQQEKSPLQYVASTLRAADADLTDAVAVTQWIADMGQPLYAYADSHGLAQNKSWLSGAQLTTRINFVLALGNHQIKGVTAPEAGPEQFVRLASPQFQMR